MDRPHLMRAIEERQLALEAVGFLHRRGEIGADLFELLSATIVESIHDLVIKGHPLDLPDPA